MDQIKHETVFRILREKSTLAGLTGLGVILLGHFGLDLPPDEQASINELVLMLISITAIITRPRPKHYVEHSNAGAAGQRAGTSVDTHHHRVSDSGEK